MGKDVIEITNSNIEEAVKKNPVLIVDCWAPWCGPCRMMGPIFDELASEYAGKIAFGKLNTDENQDAASKYQIMAIPTFLIFKNGELVERKTGAMPKQAFAAELDKQLA